MSLPTRLYFPLEKAAKELGCDVADLVHFAANGYINFCVKVYETPIGIDEISDDWSADLLVNENYLNKIVAEYYYPYFKDEKYEADKLGVYSAKDETNFDFVNSYVRLQGKIDFWVDKESGKVVDYSTELYGLYGLLQIDSRDIYINEENLLNGTSFEPSSFVLPIDDVHQLANGFFKRNVSEFAHDGWVSDHISRDTEYLRSNSVENLISKLNDPLVISLNDIYVTLDEVIRVKSTDEKDLPKITGNQHESAKTISKKGEIIHSLLELMPAFSDINLDSMSVARIKEIVETLAADKGVDFPETHAQTWARYLGRERKVR